MPSLEFLNSFSAGMDKDSSKTSNFATKYRDGKNWRLITDKGESSYSLENIKGNRLFFSLPTTSPVFSFQVNLVGVGGTHGSNDTITVGVNLTTYILYSNNSPNGETSDTRVYRDIIVSRINAATSLDVNGISIINPLKAFNIVAVPSGGDTILLYSTGTSVTTFSVGLTFHVVDSSIATIVTAQSNLRIIGWTTIRDDFILLTCSENNPSTGGPGQIWRLTYSPETIGTSYAFVLTLLYNNNLNFTALHPIPSPGAIVGRYENQDTKRIYFTDNFNPVRKFNTGDPNGFGVEVDIFNLLSSVTHSVPILETTLPGGSLLVGIYQYAYNLSTLGGQETLFSSLSNMIPVNVALEDATDVRTYIGVAAGTASSKQITCIIKDLDIDFDTIRIVSFFRKNDFDIPEIRIIKEEPLPADGVFRFTHTGSEIPIAILTLEEFTINSSPFTHCKSLEQKHNILFAANVTNRRLNLNYDARAFRHNSGGLQGPNTISGYVVGTEPDTFNDINPDQQTFKFQNGGQVIGGTGFPNVNNSNLPNIQYEIRGFGLPTLAPLSIDRNHLQDSKAFTNGSGGYPIVPHRLPNPADKTVNIGITNQDYRLQYAFENYSAPSHHGLFKSYARRETYRFGIVFYSLDGTPDFIKWIADITMPYYTDGFRISSRDVENVYTHPLFLRFNVNIPSSIRSRISGFSIVRAKRTQGDKTVLSQGVALGSGYVQMSNFDIYPWPYWDMSNPFNYYLRGFFPDYQFEDNLDYRDGDRLVVVQRLQTSQFVAYAAVGGAVSDLTVISRKVYDSVNMPAGGFGSADIIYGVGVPQGAVNFPLDVGKTFNNRLLPNGSSDTIRGQKCFMMHINNIRDTNGNLVMLVSGQPDGVYLVNYERASSAQYGGNSIAQKATSTYISCGHFQPVNQSSTSAQSFTFDVYGGDIFMPVWDFQERLKNVDTVTQRDDYSHVNFFIPLETTLDIDMRLGRTVNRNDFNGNGRGGDLDENLTIPKHYNIENDVKEYFPKPVNFNIIEEFDNRIHASQVKINGEETDQWTKFLVADKIDVEGSYGPINNLVKSGEDIIYFQDKGFGSLSINPQVIIQDQTGAKLQLGTGGVLEAFSYISTEVGCKHQWGMVSGPSGLVAFFDIYKKKFYLFSGKSSPTPLSDIKGLQSFFSNNLRGVIQSSDNPLVGMGITCTYDYRFNDFIFTFKDLVNNPNGIFSRGLSSNFFSISGLPEGVVNELAIGAVLNITYAIGTVIKTGQVVLLSKDNSDEIYVENQSLLLPPQGHTVTLVGTFASNFTIAYNVLTQAFTFFYDFRPSLYLNDKRIIISPNPLDEKTCHIHNEEIYGSFYGTLFPSSLEIFVNPESSRTKVFDNVVWHTEVTVNGGPDMAQKTFDTMRGRNDYQDTGVNLLTVGGNLKRKERSWNVAVPRAVGGGRARMRDKYLRINLTYTNQQNRRMVMHFLKSIFKISAR